MLLVRLALATFAAVVPLSLAACCVCGNAVDNFNRFECRAKQSEAKENLAMLHKLELAHHEEHGRYGDLDEVGFEPLGEHVRYTYVITALEQDRYAAEARGLADGMEGDIWAVDQGGKPAVVASVCGPVPDDQGPPASGIEVRGPAEPERLYEVRRSFASVAF